MRKLGDQWIEMIDGQEHMFKAVLPIVNGHPDIKDLGILRNGKLPSSFGVYPTTLAPEDENEPWCLYAWIAENGKIIKEVKAWGETERQAIDAWNRRV